MCPPLRLVVWCFALSLLLGGCRNAQGDRLKTGTSSALSSALNTASQDAVAAGRYTEAVALAERVYRENPRSEKAMIDYARALRRANQLDAAQIVLQSAAEKKGASVPVMTSYASVLLAQGDYATAETISRRAVEKKSGDPLAQQALGLSLSGLGQDGAAETHFRTSLLRWPDNQDKTPIINNLAMNLAAQGKLAEAKTIMALATGEALQSETYRNNRALLNALRSEIPVDAVPAAPVAAVEKSALTAKKPTGKKSHRRKADAVPPITRPLTTKVKMDPIVE